MWFVSKLLVDKSKFFGEKTMVVRDSELNLLSSNAVHKESKMSSIHCNEPSLKAKLRKYGRLTKQIDLPKLALNMFALGIKKHLPF